MKKAPLIIAALGVFFTPALHAADGEPYNLRIIQRDAAGNPITLDYQGSDYPNQVVGFNNLGVFSPLTLTASIVTDFASAVRAQIEGALIAGANVTITPSGSGASRQYTITATGGPGGSMPDIPAGTVLARSASGTGPASAHTVVAPLVVSGGQITLPVNYQLADPVLDDLTSGIINGQVVLQGGYKLRGPASIDYQSMVGTTMGYPARGAEIYVATGNNTLTVPATGTPGDIYYLWIAADGTQRTTTFSTPLWNGRASVPSIVTPANGDDYLVLKRESDRWVIQGDPPAETGTGPFARQEGPSLNNAVLNGNTTITNLIATLLAAGSIEYEGTPDDFETTITFENPTGDRAWRFPNIASPGDVLSTAGAQTISGKIISGASNTISNIPLGTAVTGNLPVANLNGGSGASNTTYWRGDGTWSTPPGSSGSVATDGIFNAKGDLPVGTANDTAARLGVGTNGQVLTADSAEATGLKWATPAAGSSLTISSYKQDIPPLVEEFMGVLNSTSVAQGPLGLIAEGSGTGNGTPVAGDTTCLGMQQLSTGTGTTGYRGLISGGTAASSVLFGGAAFTWQTRFNVGQASDGAGTYNTRAGFIDSVSSTEPVDGVYFRTAGVSPANLIAVCRSNNSESGSTVDTGIALPSSGWVHLAIDVNAAANEAKFWVNGTLGATITTNIPSGSGRNTAVGVTIFKTTTAGDRWITMDYMLLDLNLTSARP